MEYLQSLPERPVAQRVEFGDLLRAMGGPLPESPGDPLAVIQQFAEAAAPGLVASPGPRYFGFVIGGALPVTVAAEWLASAWDQNAFCYVLSPAAATAEEIAARWLLECSACRAR